MPTTLATCEVYGTIYDVFGVAVEGAIVGVMAVYKNGALVLASTREVTTDADGYFTMDLPRDSVAVLYANTPGLNISCLGTPTAIPDAATAELTSIVGDFDIWNEVPIAIPGGASIGTPIGGGTPQAILFIDSGGGLGQDPPKLMYDGAGVLLPGPPTLPLHATPRSYVDSAIAAIPPSGANPAGTGTEIQYRLNATTLGAVPSVVTGSAVRFLGDIEVDGNYAMASGAGGTYFTVPDLANAVPPVSIFYAINNSANSRYIYFGRGDDGFGPRKVPRFISFYTGPTGDEGLRRMYLSPAGCLVINVQALADQVAALTVNAAGNSTFAKALQVNGVGEMSADPTTPLGIATRQYVDAHGVSLAADYAWTGKHAFANAQAVTLACGAAVRGTYNNATVTQLLTLDGLNTTYVGPLYDYAGTTLGSVVNIVCGTGAWGGLGICQINGPSGVWDFMAHLNVRGSLTLTNQFAGGLNVQGANVSLSGTAAVRASYASGNQTPMLEINQFNHYVNIGPQYDYGGSTGGSAVVYCCGTGGWSAFSYGACIVNYGNNYTWDFNAHLNVRGRLVISGEFNGGAFSLYLGSSLVKIGAAGSGPGGTGRALYVD